MGKSGDCGCKEKKSPEVASAKPLSPAEQDHMRALKESHAAMSKKVAQIASDRDLVIRSAANRLAQAQTMIDGLQNKVEKLRKLFEFALSSTSLPTEEQNRIRELNKGILYDIKIAPNPGGGK